jgi:hypothetical protein
LQLEDGGRYCSTACATARSAVWPQTTPRERSSDAAVARARAGHGPTRGPRLLIAPTTVAPRSFMPPSAAKGGQTPELSVCQTQPDCVPEAGYFTDRLPGGTNLDLEPPPAELRPPNWRSLRGTAKRDQEALAGFPTHCADETPGALKASPPGGLTAGLDCPVQPRMTPGLSAPPGLRPNQPNDPQSPNQIRHAQFRQREGSFDGLFVGARAGRGGGVAMTRHPCRLRPPAARIIQR